MDGFLRVRRQESLSKGDSLKTRKAYSGAGLESSGLAAIHTESKQSEGAHHASLTHGRGCRSGQEPMEMVRFSG
jgi:hypothetical protein